MQNSSLQLDHDYLRAIHIGEIAFSYYQIQRAAPTKEDYTQWLSSLPLLLHSRFSTIAFEDGKDSLDFRRYFLELRKLEMKAYMQKNLNSEDFRLWQEMRDMPETL